MLAPSPVLPNQTLSVGEQTPIAILTHKDDLHALVIDRRLKELGAVCHVVEMDDQLLHGGVVWENSGGLSRGELRTRTGEWIDASSLGVIWSRRIGAPQRDAPASMTEFERSFLSAEWRTAILGTLATTFRGTWINHPQRSREADNKLLQLQMAQGCGLNVPRTLVSQDPRAVRGFAVREPQRELVVKKIIGVAGPPTQTVRVTASELPEDAVIALCPGLYQQLIPGDRHLRVHCFGSEVVTVAIETEVLDWRVGLPGAYTLSTLDPTDEERVKRLVERLGLRMAILDFKIDHEGCMWFLEANPQGQFLWVEGRSGIDMVNPFCSFLMAASHEAVQISRPAQTA